MYIKFSYYTGKLSLLLQVCSTLLLPNPTHSFETPIMSMFVCLMVSHGSLRLCSFFFLIFFLLVYIDNFNYLIIKFADLFSLPVNWCWYPVVKSPFLHFSYYTFQLQNFCLVLFIILSLSVTDLGRQHSYVFFSSLSMFPLALWIYLKQMI